jgi:hypothetical protein
MPYPPVRVPEIIQKNDIDIVFHRKFDCIGGNGCRSSNKDAFNFLFRDFENLVFVFNKEAVVLLF